MTTRYERLQARRRLRQRIRLVVEERRSALGVPAARPGGDPETDPDATAGPPAHATGRP